MEASACSVRFVLQTIAIYKTTGVQKYVANFCRGRPPVGQTVAVLFPCLVQVRSCVESCIWPPTGGATTVKGRSVAKLAAIAVVTSQRVMRRLGDLNFPRAKRVGRVATQTASSEERGLQMRMDLLAYVVAATSTANKTQIKVSGFTDQIIQLTISWNLKCGPWSVRCRVSSCV